MKYLILAVLMAVSMSSFAVVKEQPAHRRTLAKQAMLRKHKVILPTPRVTPRQSSTVKNK